MKSSPIQRSIFSILLPVGLVFFIFFKGQSIYENLDDTWKVLIKNTTIPAQNLTKIEAKQKGVHFFSVEDSTNLQPLFQYNLEWITMVSWAFQDDYDSPMVSHHNGDSLYIWKHDSSWVNRIALVREAGFKVFLKPHLWINSPSNGTWRSDIFPNNEEDWKLWQESYRHFIIRYAKVAQRGQAEMFCIGVEFSRLAVEKPLFWKQLIQEIRSIYDGKITYAANWYKEYENITFWEDLDYIGVQAYFPLVSNEYPGVQQISKGWNQYLPTMEALSKKYHRKILFTEMGYKSTADSAIKPWEWVEHPARKNSVVSMETQANCYQAFFDTVWKKDWFAGVHIWQMRTDYNKKNRYYQLDFIPQGKPAEHIITKGFE